MFVGGDESVGAFGDEKRVRKLCQPFASRIGPVLDRFFKHPRELSCMWSQKSWAGRRFENFWSAGNNFKSTCIENDWHLCSGQELSKKTFQNGSGGESRTDDKSRCALKKCIHRGSLALVE
jgi:hypothetical protein